MYEAFLKSAGYWWIQIDRLLNKVFGSRFNFVYYHSSWPSLVFWLEVLTGIFIFMYFVPTLEGAYASVTWFTTTVPYGSIVRSLHRYGGDAFVIFSFLHLLRVWLTDRYRAARTNQWISGVVMLAFVFFIGISGYVLAWDERAILITQVTADALRQIPGAGVWLSGFFLGGAAINDLTLSRFLFFHIGLPFLFFFLMWWHFYRISRAVVYPPRALQLMAFGTLLVIAALYPAVSTATPGNPVLPPSGMEVDWFFLLPYVLTASLPAVQVVALLFFITVVLFFLPYYTQRPYSNVAEVIEEKCVGCYICAKDCTANAIIMVPTAVKRGSKPKFLAQVLEARCVECGICVGSCNFQAIELPGYREKALDEMVVALAKGDA